MLRFTDGDLKRTIIDEYEAPDRRLQQGFEGPFTAWSREFSTGGSSSVPTA